MNALVWPMIFIESIAVARDASRMLVATEDGGASEWRLPEAKLVLGLAAPPPEPLAPDAVATEHDEAPDAIAVRPDGREVLVARGARVLRHAMADGRVTGEWRSPSGSIRSLAWSPDGRVVALVARGDGTVHLVRPEDGSALRGLEVDREAWAAGFSPDGRLVAVGSAAGGTTLFDASRGSRRSVIDPAGRPVTGVGFLRERDGLRLVTSSRSGVVATWAVRDGRRIGESPPGRGFHALAVDPVGGRIAIGGSEGDLRLVAPDGRVVERLLWHGAEVSGLAFADRLLVSGDRSGRVAVWDLAEPAPSPTPAPRARTATTTRHPRLP